jgi:hypothetical protein
VPRSGLIHASFANCELAVVGLELDPRAALEILRDLEELVVDDLGLLPGLGVGLRHRLGERLGLRRFLGVAVGLRLLRFGLRLLGHRCVERSRATTDGFTERRAPRPGSP